LLRRSVLGESDFCTFPLAGSRPLCALGRVFLGERRTTMSRVLNPIGIAACLGCVLALGAASSSQAKQPQDCAQQVIVPEEDRFSPFALTIHAGDCVQWVNEDT